ncbi:MAG: hypothetical protein ACI9K2_004354, partial [Myxococcota bacterium]
MDKGGSERGGILYEAGDLIDIWVVERALGAGGMASVYRCHNKDAPRIRAAIKVLDSMLSRDERLRQRFINEAVILYDLDHPNIVRVKNVRTNTRPPYLEMEFVEGESLDDRLRRGALPFAESLDLIRQTADALSYLHARNVCHRDIKPANILLRSDGAVKFVDFGLAVEVDRTRITEKGVSFGTVSYAPPEWVAPDRLDPRKWDIYALGVVYWECMTGKVAFPVSGQGSAKQQAMQVMMGKQSHPPLDPGPAYHGDVRELIREMTRSDPDFRMADAQALAKRAHLAVPAMRRGGGVTLAVAGDDATDGGDPAATWRGDSSDFAHPPTVPEDTTTPSSRARTLVPIAVGAGAVGLLGLFGLAAALVAAIVLTSDPAPATVEVSLTGLPADVPAHVQLDGRAPDEASGFHSTFVDVPRGPVALTWTIGCEPCLPADCAPWCGRGSSPAVVDAAEQSITLELPPVPTRSVAVTLPGDAAPARAELGGVAGRWSDGTVTFAVPPGEHALVLAVGECAPDCPDGPCGDGCAVHTETVVVPWSGELPQLHVPLTPPEPPAEDPEPAPVAAA